MVFRRLIYFGMFAALPLSLAGCGVDSQGRQKLGGLEVCLCGGAALGAFAVMALGAILVLRGARRASPRPGPTAAAPHIFISYRRNDSQDVAGRIYDALVNRFSAQCVFKDVDSIPVGKDFRKVLREAVRRAEVVVVIIGPRWLKAIDAAGKRRLEDPNDFVRIEIESALEMGIPLIPVMVSNARMVSATDLPTTIQPLVFQNGLPVRPDPDFHRDIARLIGALENIVPGAGPAPAPASKPAAKGSLFWLGGCGVAVVLVLIALVVLGALIAFMAYRA